MILSIDQGTSSTKVCLFDAEGRLLGRAASPVRRKRTADGSIVQDPDELAASCREAASAALDGAGVRPSALEGVALANQGESFLLVDRQGRPQTPVYSWLDPNAGEVLARPSVRDNAGEITRRTGLPLHSEFVAPRLSFRFDQLGARSGEVRLATLDTWLIHQLSADRELVTDRATASRTMLVGLEADNWDDELVGWFGLRSDLLPRIVGCDELTSEVIIDGASVPLLASSFDMGLALLGHGCFSSGEVKATFGTCLGVMAATGSGRLPADGLLGTIAYTLGGCSAMALDGEIAAAGALIDWAVSLGVARSPRELDERAASVADAGGVVLVPAINGLGAPHWCAGARASFVGLSSATGPDHLARAVYDAIGWSIRDVCEAVRDAGIELEVLRVDGGLTWSRTLMQICADICQLPLVVSPRADATAYGGAVLAMLRTGKLSEAQVRRQVDDGGDAIDPGAPPPEKNVEAWEAAVKAALHATHDP